MGLSIGNIGIEVEGIEGRCRPTGTAGELFFGATRVSGAERLGKSALSACERQCRTEFLQMLELPAGGRHGQNNCGEDERYESPNEVCDPSIVSLRLIGECNEFAQIRGRGRRLFGHDGPLKRVLVLLC